MLVDRPYVVAFLAAFLVISGSERGWQRTLFWLASGTFLGWLMEFSSIRTGFPFGLYTYHQDSFRDELSLGRVPLFASLSFAFLTYFGYSAACTFLSPLRWRGADIQREAGPQVDRSLRVLVLAAIIATWADIVIDPVTHLGEYWFLGDLYTYEEEGIHFDVPLTNYAGWLFTGLCIVFVNQRFDAWLRGREAPGVSEAEGVRLRGFRLPFEPLWAVGSLLGNFAFILGVTVYLLTSDRVPASVPAGQILASGLALSALFAAFAALMIRRGLARNLAFAPAAL